MSKKPMSKQVKKYIWFKFVDQDNQFIDQPSVEELPELRKSIKNEENLNVSYSQSKERSWNRIYYSGCRIFL